MNLAIEYALRTEFLKELVQFPCSLFLVQVDKGHRKKVVVVEDGTSSFTVKHWNLWECSNETGLPKSQCFSVPKTELYASPLIVVPSYRNLHYDIDAYSHTDRQTSDPPLGTIQEKRYRTYIEQFFFSQRHRVTRKEWLWGAFVAAFLPESCNIFGDYRVESQINLLEENFPSIWKKWCSWSNIMLHSSGVAPDLLYEPIFRASLEKQGLLVEKLDFRFPSPGFPNDL